MTGEEHKDTFQGGVELSAEAVKALNDLFERGLYLQAYESAKVHGPLPNWRGPAAMVMAGRLAHHLGSASLSARITARAAKLYPSDPLVQYYHTYTILEWRGPLPAWNHLRKLGDMPHASAEEQADLCSIRAQVAASFRDFQTAEQWLLKAEELHPKDPWLAVSRCHLLESQDRYEEALAASIEAVKLHRYPYYRAGILAQAHGLQLLNRDQEALELLKAASQHLESAAVETLLFALQVELERPEEALQTLDRYERLTPLREKGTDEWLRSQRSRLAHLCGNREEALRLARTLDDKFHKGFAERLADPEHQPRKVKLPVSFVRQNYRTCAPATLAALGRYWQLSTDHLQLVAAMCYDGTPAYRQREWAEQNGWLVKEFTLTWEAATQLLDAGLPFALTTVDTANAHLQAVVGYDTLRRSFLLRDPYNPYLREAVAEPFLEHYAANGPRCFVMVPQQEAARLQTIELPEAAWYDLDHQLELALSRHDRPAAVEKLNALAASAGDHLLTWKARRALAAYDSDSKEGARCVNALLEKFPKDANLLLSKTSYLREGPRTSLLEFLTELCMDKAVDPIFYQQLAIEQLADARLEASAERLLMKSLRHRPYDATSLHVLADLRWQQRDLPTAFELYRFAASLEDKREEPTRALFAASRHLRKHHEIIGYLRDRFQRFGRYSHLSLTTLFWSEVDLTETAMAFKHLGIALEWRPEDSGLRCFAADVYARFGHYPEARAHLQAAQGRTRQLDWLRTSAHIATMEDRRPEALTLWQEVLVQAPMALDAHESMLQLLAETEGPAAVSQHLKRLGEAFPHNIDLQQLCLNWLRKDDHPAAIKTAERLVALHPANAWARRELADLLGEAGETERALREVDLALQLEPKAPFGYCVRGHLYQKLLRPADAQKDYEAALRLSVDNDFAQRALLELCETHAEKKAALNFIEQELSRQVIFGSGLVVFRELAHPILEPKELVTSLRQAHRERPDLWHTWSCLIQQLSLQTELGEAERLAREATSRFPLLPRMWIDFATIRRMQENISGEIECLETAVRLSPAWSYPARQLAEAYERAGDFWKARRLLETTLVRLPLEAVLHQMLAHFLWKTGDRDEGLQRLQKAIDTDPGMMWAWEQLPIWGKERGQPDLAINLARKLVETRAGEIRSWLLLAEHLEGRAPLEERLAAVEKALQLQPKSAWAHQIKAELLAQAGRVDEALKVCQAPVFGGKPPRELRLLGARIERIAGNNKRSLTCVEELVKEHPDYGEAWNRLARWHLDEGDLEKAARTAEHITRLDPLDPVPWGFKGAWEKERGRKDAAIQCFRKAFDLSPDYTYAAYNLFDLLVEQGQAATAAEVLHQIRKHEPGPNVLWRDIWLAVVREEKHRVPDLFIKLLQNKETESSQIQAALRIVQQAGLGKQAENIIEGCVLRGEGSTAVANMWVYLHVSRTDWNCIFQLAGRSACARFLQPALHEWLYQMTEAIKPIGDDFSKRLRFIWRARKCRQHFAAEMQNDTALWAQYSIILINLKRHRAAADWVKDWPERKGLEIWMLHNAALAHERVKEDAQAAAAFQMATRLEQRDNAAAPLYCRAAIDLALEGRHQEAGQLIGRVNLNDVSEYEQIYWRLANMLFRITSMPGHSLNPADQELLNILLERRKDRPQDLRLLRRIVKFLDNLHGNQKLKWWLLRHEQWEVAVIVAVIAILIKLFILP